MKGTLKLSSIIYPVKDMLAIFGEQNIIVTIDTVLEDRLHCTIKPDMISVCYVTDLQQIVIEDRSKPTDMATRGASMGTYLFEELPLHKDDWEYAINHIGEELEFMEAGDVDNKFAVLENNKIYQRVKKFKEQYAMRPAPAMYTQDDVDRIRLYAQLEIGRAHV